MNPSEEGSKPRRAFSIRRCGSSRCITTVTDGKACPECDRSSTRIAKPSSVEYVCKRSHASSFFPFFRSRSNSTAQRAPEWYKVSEFLIEKDLQNCVYSVSSDEYCEYIFCDNKRYIIIFYFALANLIRFDMICNVLCQQNIYQYFIMCEKYLYYFYLAFLFSDNIDKYR